MSTSTEVKYNKYMEIDEVTYDEIRAAKDDGLNTVQIADEFNVSLEEVNKVITTNDYRHYSGKKPQPKHEVATITKEGQEKKGTLRKEIAKSDPMKNLSSVEKDLLFTIKGLWTMVDMLTSEKTKLEKDILFMKEYLRRGINLAEEHIEK